MPKGGGKGGGRGTKRDRDGVPLCKTHNERCKLKTTFKEGPNKGRRFWTCRRPRDDPAPEGSCNFFAWAQPDDSTPPPSPPRGSTSPQQGLPGAATGSTGPALPVLRFQVIARPTTVTGAAPELRIRLAASRPIPDKVIQAVREREARGGVMGGVSLRASTK